MGKKLKSVYMVTYGSEYTGQGDYFRPESYGDLGKALKVAEECMESLAEKSMWILMKPEESHVLKQWHCPSIGRVIWLEQLEVK